jgi:hypothetical protein
MLNSSDILIESFNQAGQGQVFQFFDELDAATQAKLVAQAETIDLAEVKELVEEHVKGSQHHTLNLDGLEPAPYEALAANGGDSPNGVLLGMPDQLPCRLVVWQPLLWQVVKARASAMMAPRALTL